MPYYRTSNYAGLPKGSYSIPNPQHFHVVRQIRVAQPLRPHLVKIVPSQNRTAHYIFNRFRVNCDKNTQTVTINLGNVRTVSLDMSVQTMNDFIRPFAEALNLLQIPDSNHRASQTAYITDYDENKVDVKSEDHMPLIENGEKNENSKISDDSNFEKRILQKLQENLIADLTKSSDSESDLESDDFLVFDLFKEEKENNVKEEDEIMEFTEDDSVKENESMADASYISEIGNIYFTDQDLVEMKEIHNVCIPQEMNNSDDSITTIPDIVTNGRFNISLSPDEGVCDLTKVTLPKKITIQSDERVVKIGQVIFNYLLEQGFENSELVIFPELLNDTNTNKLMTKLTQLYKDLYGENLTEEEKSNLRLVISSYVLSMVENDDRMMSSTDSLETQMVSDKVFSVSETLSAIMDYFFDLIDQRSENENEILNDFATSINGNITHSTPDLRKSQFSFPTETCNIVEEVTAFKKNQSDKSGVESYWFSIGSPKEVKSNKTTSSRKIVNVDEIPLPLPKDSSYFDDPDDFQENKVLSPIPEEASRNLYFDFLEHNYENIQGREKEIDILGGGDNKKIENILSGDGSCTYVSFEKPETNVVVSQSVSFCRTITTMSSAYIKSNSVLLKKLTSANGNGDESFHSAASHCSTNDKNDSDDEGDWMGYEGAKF